MQKTYNAPINRQSIPKSEPVLNKDVRHVATPSSQTT